MTLLLFRKNTSIQHQRTGNKKSKRDGVWRLKNLIKPPIEFQFVIWRMFEGVRKKKWESQKVILELFAHDTRNVFERHNWMAWDVNPLIFSEEITGMWTHRCGFSGRISMWKFAMAEKFHLYHPNERFWIFMTLQFDFEMQSQRLVTVAGIPWVSRICSQSHIYAFHYSHPLGYPWPWKRIYQEWSEWDFCIWSTYSWFLLCYMGTITGSLSQMAL